MFRIKYRLIERAGLYRAQWSRIGIFWKDIGWSQDIGSYDSDLGYTFLTEERARDAIKGHKHKRLVRTMPWRVIEG